MRVKAIEVGFYEKLREVGDVFDVPTGTEGTWFVREDGEPGKPRVGGRGDPPARAVKPAGKPGRPPKKTVKAPKAETPAPDDQAQKESSSAEQSTNESGQDNDSQ